MKLKKSVKKAILRFILFILTIVFLVILGFSVYKIVFWLKENKKSNNIKEMISNYVVIKEDKEKSLQIDFSKLKAINSEVIAYLKVSNTKIDYPVVKGNDNAYYLTHSFDKSNNSAGWVFANYQNSFDGDDKNISIFGHARLNGSMFGSLKDTLTSSWQKENKEKQIIFATEEETSYYEVFSTYKVLIEEYYLQNEFKNEEDYETFLDIITKRSNHDYQVKLTSDDEILTLSTCDFNNNYRIVLHAKKIINEEPIN